MAASASALIKFLVSGVSDTCSDTTSLACGDPGGVATGVTPSAVALARGVRGTQASTRMPSPAARAATSRPALADRVQSL